MKNLQKSQKIIFWKQTSYRHSELPETSKMDIERNLKFQIGDTVYLKAKYRVIMPNSEGGYGWITGKCENSELFQVRYVINNIMEENIDLTRLMNTPVDSITGVFMTRSNNIVQEVCYNPNLTTPTINTTLETTIYYTLTNVLLKSYNWKYNEDTTTHPLVIFLKYGINKQPVWIKTTNNNKLTNEDNLFVIIMSTLLNGLHPNIVTNPIQLINHAYGTRNNTPEIIFNQMVTHGGKIKRKPRSDLGKNIFNSD